MDTPSKRTRSAEAHRTRARVYADGAVVHYRRAGCGAPIVVLTADPRQPGEAVLDRLAERFRVIRPDTDDLGGDVASRLRSFLDGLGASGVGVVAAGALGAGALELARAESGHVSGVAFVGDREAAREDGWTGDDAAEGGARSEKGRASARAAPVPVLALASGDAAAVARALIAFFERLADPMSAS